MRRNRSTIALGTILLTVLAVAAGSLSSNVALRTIAMSPLIFFLTGYSILQAIKERLANFETAIFSVAMSIAVTAVGGLLLNMFGGLSALGWDVLLATITISASLSSVARGGRDLVPAESFPRVPPVYWGICAAAGAIGLSAVAIARVGAEHQHEYAFTELWMVAGTGSSENLATYGIRNAEDVTTTYAIALFADGATIGRRSGILLQPGETWTDVLPLNGRLGQASRVEARLFRANEPDTTYRKVWLSNTRDALSSKKEQD